MTLNIGGIDYTFEFSIEASLYNECTERIADLFSKITEAQNEENLKMLISGLGNVPKTALEMFYAGLLEHHGEFGDGTILTINDAKNLIREYIHEHKEDGKGNFYNIMNLMIEQMTEDGFFEQIGLTQMIQEEVQTKEVKKPQDHKKKATTTRKSTKVGEK